VGARFQNVDMSLFRSFPFGEKRSLQFRAEAFNLLNHPNLGLPDNDGRQHAVVRDPNFGKITSLRGIAHELQLALKLIF
jgi:hypothetical protein